eukprot:symbB.v1.2.021960.t1/scaffold1930.1/size95793/2
MAEGDRGNLPKHPQQLFFDNVNPATRLLEKRRQMYEVQDALENQKARFAKEEEQFRKKEEQLRIKDLRRKHRMAHAIPLASLRGEDVSRACCIQTPDLHLQNQLVKFNKFLQDNEAKRRRSETRAHEEAAQIKQKDDEIMDLEKQLQDSKATCTKLEEEKDRNMKYEEIYRDELWFLVGIQADVSELSPCAMEEAEMDIHRVANDIRQKLADQLCALALSGALKFTVVPQRAAGREERRQLRSKEPVSPSGEEYDPEIWTVLPSPEWRGSNTLSRGTCEATKGLEVRNDARSSRSSAPSRGLVGRRHGTLVLVVTSVLAVCTVLKLRKNQ